MNSRAVAPSGSAVGELGPGVRDHHHHHLSPTAAPDPDADGSPSSSPAPRAWLTSTRRPRTSPGPQPSALRGVLLADDDTRRDSALTSSHCIPNGPPSPHSLHRTPSLPAIVVHDEHPPAPYSCALHTSLDLDELRQGNGAAFVTLDTIIPTGALDDLTSTSHVSFTNRGSMLLGGKKANRRSKVMDCLVESTPTPTPSTPTPSTPPPPPPPPPAEQAQPNRPEQLTPPNTTHLTPRSTSRYTARGRSTSRRVLSTDEMMLSRKVRTMYKHGDEGAVNWDEPDEDTSSVNTSGLLDNSSLLNTPVNISSLTVDRSRDDSKSFVSSRRGSVIRKTRAERAGGLEDWTDLEGGEVDRYGFIIPRKTRSKDGANDEGLDGPDEPRLQRVTTSLQLVAQEPRRRHMGRSLSRTRSIQSTDPRTEPHKRRASWKSVRPSRSIFSNHTSSTRTTQKPLRYMTNKLPHNRERRMLDEASDMLKLPPGLAEVAEKREGGRAALAMRAKEIQRDEKWRRMAKVVTSGACKGGMLFEFDVKDSKVVSRTWKGIPDRWRATAWYSFLAASAKKDPNSPSEEELIESFYELQGESSAEDVQIDVDVPRTINRHIMFRRRYRGGQRLLFRVLHAMSLYLPETGYVQGMAALAATLLCYYEEDRAFVMLVRLWMLRGLERLYESGFSGLTDALEDFEKNWLRGGDVAQKLEDLDIHPTAWGTRWYLTLFNYSLPFPAQLRIWDVFMLLGDSSYSSSPCSKFSGDLDVLHATSAALIDATREILLDSDFENAMKVLTSWIPIKDEELLMRVAKAEYRMRKKRANA